MRLPLCAAELHLDRAYHVPEPVVRQELVLVEGRLLQLRDRLADFRALHQLLGDLPRVLVDFREEPQPEHRHLLGPPVPRRELRELDEYEPQPLDDLPRLRLLHYPVVVVVVFAFRERVVHEVERVHRLQELVVLPLVELADVGLRGVEEDPLPVCRRPHHLHLHDELSPVPVPAPHVHDAVLPEGIHRHEFGIHVFDGRDFLLFPVEGEESVQQADDQVWVFAEHFLESEVGLGAQVSHFVQMVVLCLKNVSLLDSGAFPVAGFPVLVVHRRSALWFPSRLSRVKPEGDGVFPRPSGV